MLPKIALSMLALSSRASPPHSSRPRASTLVSAFRHPSSSVTTYPTDRRRRGRVIDGDCATASAFHSSPSAVAVRFGFTWAATTAEDASRSWSGLYLAATVEECIGEDCVDFGEAEVFRAETEAACAATEATNGESERADDSRSADTNAVSSRRRILSLVENYRTMRDLEKAIVRLGRQGRTDDALSLYRAVWSLDAERQRIRQQTQKNNGNENSNGDLALATIVRKSSLRPTTRLMNVAIDACARASPTPRQIEAFELFRAASSGGGGLSPNVFTFGSLLAACARNGDADAALELLKRIENHEYADVVPNGVIYSTAISACQRADPPRPDTALALLNHAIDEAASTGMEVVSVVGFNTVISAMARAGKWQTAVRLLDEMLFHSCSYSTPYDTDDTLWDSLCPGSAELPPLLKIPPTTGDAGANASAFVPEPDEVTYGTLMAACERAGQWEELLRIARAARSHPGVDLDGMALTSALKACQQLGRADDAMAYLDVMKQLGGNENSNNGNGDGKNGRTTRGRMRKGARQALRGPDGVAYSLAISACARASGGSRWRDGVRLLHEMRDDAAAGAAAKQRSIENGTHGSSDGAYSPTEGPDVVAYTAAIAGCSEAGEYLEALRLIRDMRAEGVRPNVVTFSAVIDACATAGANLARRREEESDVGESFGSESATDSLAEVRTPMRKALQILEAMRKSGSSVRPNIFAYNAAIRACAEGMNLEGAFGLLQDLQDDGLEPTIVTYGSLMTACERVGNVEAASRVFRMVKCDERIDANEIIYGAAISCCKKAGQPERAMLLLRKMISEKLAPNTATFNTVITAVAEERPSSSSPSPSTGRLWEKAVSVYKVMKSKHAPPGVAPNRQTYNALVKTMAANLQPAYAESFLNAMRKDGYVPDVDLYTITIRSYERCGNPMKALRLMEAMEEVGYDFYDSKVLNKAFKNAVKLVNKVGLGFSDGEDAIPTRKEEDVIYFDEDYDEDQVLRSFK